MIELDLDTLREFSLNSPGIIQKKADKQYMLSNKYL